MKRRICTFEHVSGRPIATGKLEMERVSKESGDRELEDATGQLKAGNEGLQKNCCVGHMGEAHKQMNVEEERKPENAPLHINMTHTHCYRS